MVHNDPYTPTRSYYECIDCGHREVADSVAFCPNCGGHTTNIAVARE
ncbi:rubrerythrin-like domain-containing protein [Natronorubrum thiooxidans]|nr:rubrerythrin-like domain-containing protein [Natronorubrum thiooxidans]